MLNTKYNKYVCAIVFLVALYGCANSPIIEEDLPFEFKVFNATDMELRLVNKETGEIKEQDVSLGSIPLMTDKGSFIVNGIERVVVNQIVRAPGVFFSDNKKNPYGSAKIIPKRGAWLEVETSKT